MNEDVWIVVPAAGYGERMGRDVPKQYLAIGGQSILQHTLDRLLNVPNIQGIVVVLASDDTHWPELDAARDARVHTVIGGPTRTDSVVSGLRYVSRQSPQASWALVHDAARPLIDVSDVQRLRNAVFNSGAMGGILATPVQDTLKKADDYYGIEQTVNRDQLWQAQTPQLFRVDELLTAIEAAGSEEPGTTQIPLTDEASAMERQGHQPLLVEALQPNLKITRPADLIVAAALLGAQDSHS